MRILVPVVKEVDDANLEDKLVKVTNIFRHPEINMEGAYYIYKDYNRQKSIDTILSGRASFISRYSTVKNSRIVGSVISSQCKISDSNIYDAVIRQACTITNSKVYAKSHIGSNTHLVGTYVGSYTEINEGSIITNSTIGDSNLIGSGCILDGVVVQDDFALGYDCNIEGKVIVSNVPCGLSLQKDDWYMAFDNVGSRESMLFVTASENCGVRWTTGCQHNITTRHFKERVCTTHEKGDKHYNMYMAIIKMVEGLPEVKAILKAKALADKAKQRDEKAKES